MLPHTFAYARPESVSEAVNLLNEHRADSKVLAGGQSLIPLMKLRLASPRVLIDLNGIRELSGIRAENGGIVVGAMTRHREVGASQIIRDSFPLLTDAAATLGDPQVRNRGTIGGALAHADPASDWATTLLALDAELETSGSRGHRRIPIGSFFREPFVTALEPGELLTQIHLAGHRPKTGSSYLKLKRKTGDFATVSVAAVVTLDGGGAIHSARVSLGGVGPTPLRATRAEAALAGHPADVATRSAAADLAAAECHPAGDRRGSEEYKRAMVAVYTNRALEKAVERARGGAG